jgi:hypothetical protein
MSRRRRRARQVAVHGPVGGQQGQQGPGKCAWPFHQPLYGPQTAPLVPPNGDVGVDGMVISLAALLAGTATNPYGDGYYQGEAGTGLESATACAGIFGTSILPCLSD